MSAAMDKCEEFRCRVEPFTEDFTGRLSWGELGRRILISAAVHADRRGFGMKQLLPEGMAWVVSRMAVEMDAMPATGDEYVVATWIRGIYRTFTDRCFTISRADGTPLGTALTTWALIDTATRSPKLLSEACAGMDVWVDADRPCAAGAFPRVRVAADAPGTTVTARYSDIDINRHVNSIKYVEHVMDLMPMDWHERNRVTGIAIAYHGEARCGDTLALCRQDAGAGAVDVEVRRHGLPGDERLCSMRLRFEERTDKDTQ